MYSAAEIDAHYPHISLDKVASLQAFSDELRFFAAGLIEEGFEIEYAEQMQRTVWSRESVRVEAMLEARDRECKYYGMTPSQMIDSLLGEIGISTP